MSHEISNEIYQMETADEALAEILSGMEEAYESPVNILEEPDVDPFAVPVIRDADELAEEEMMELSSDLLEEIIEDVPVAPVSRAPMYQVPAGRYGPRHAMVLMGSQDADAAKAIGTALAQAGIPVSYQNQEIGAIVHLNNNETDVVVMGGEFYNIADYVEKHASRKGTLTIGVTENGLNVDLKVPTRDALVHWAKQGGIVAAYVENEDAQAHRTQVELEAPQMMAYVTRGRQQK